MDKLRCDWRYLLPEAEDRKFRRMALLGGAPCLAERIVETGAAHEVSRSAEDVASSDALIVLHDAECNLATVLSGVKPGCVVYVEIDRRSRKTFATTPTRIVRLLRRAGLQEPHIYWVAPNFTAPKRYLPIDSPAVLKWYFDTVFVAGTPQHRLLAWMLRSLASSRRTMSHAWVPCFCVTASIRSGVARRKGEADSLALPGSPLGAVRSSGIAAADGRMVVLTSGQDASSRTVLLPFAKSAAQPSAVVKIAGLPEVNRNLEHEQAALTEIRSRLTPQMRDGIPEPTGLFQDGELTVGVESYSAGQTLWASSGLWGKSTAARIRDLRFAAEWLTRFHLEMPHSRTPWDADEITRWIEQPMTTYADLFALTEEESELFYMTRKHAHTLVGRSLPITWQHNDFGPWNVYRDGSRIRVIDWEAGSDADLQRDGPAPRDLLYLVTHWYFVVRHLYGVEAELRGIDELFISCAGNRACRAARQIIADYLAKVQIAPEFLPLILVHAWLKHAVGRAVRQVHVDPNSLDLRAGNRFVAYIESIARNRTRLFSAASAVDRRP